MTKDERSAGAQNATESTVWPTCLHRQQVHLEIGVRGQVDAITGVGRRDLVTVVRQQDQRRIDHVRGAAARPEPPRSPAEMLVERHHAQPCNQASEVRPAAAAPDLPYHAAVRDRDGAREPFPLDQCRDITVSALHRQQSTGHPGRGARDTSAATDDNRRRPGTTGGLPELVFVISSCSGFRVCKEAVDCAQSTIVLGLSCHRVGYPGAEVLGVIGVTGFNRGATSKYQVSAYDLTCRAPVQPDV